MGVGGEFSRHPDYLLESLTAEQLQSWRLYHHLYPNPILRADLNAGLIRQTVIATSGRIKKLPSLLSLLPKWAGGKRLSSRKEVIARLKQWQAESEFGRE